VAAHGEVALPTRSVRRRDDDVNSVKARRETGLHRQRQVPLARVTVVGTVASAALDGYEKILVTEEALFPLTVLILVRNDVFEGLDPTTRPIIEVRVQVVVQLSKEDGLFVTTFLFTWKSKFALRDSETVNAKSLHNVIE
jgi:hypothetical protein